MVVREYHVYSFGGKHSRSKIHYYLKFCRSLRYDVFAAKWIIMVKHYCWTIVGSLSNTSNCPCFWRSQIHGLLRIPQHKYVGRTCSRRRLLGYRALSNQTIHSQKNTYFYRLSAIFFREQICGCTFKIFWFTEENEIQLQFKLHVVFQELFPHLYELVSLLHLLKLILQRTLS